MKGGPGSWRLYFHSQEVKSLQFAMRDVPVRSGADAATFLEEARQTANAWYAVAAQLLVCRQQAHEAGAGFGVLFHCFGGINRSSGALAAWLMIAHTWTAEEAVAAILEARPSLRPWCDRDYVLWVLGSLEMQLDEVQRRVRDLARHVRVGRMTYWTPPASVL